MDRRPQEHQETLCCETSGCPMDRDAVRQPAEAAWRYVLGMLHHSRNRLGLLHLASVSFCCFAVGKQRLKLCVAMPTRFCAPSPHVSGASHASRIHRAGLRLRLGKDPEPPKPLN